MGALLNLVRARRAEIGVVDDVDDGAFLIGLLGRLQDELDRAEMDGGPEPDNTEAAEAVVRFHEMITEVNELIEALEKMAELEENEAAGHSVGRPQVKVDQVPRTKPSSAAPRAQRRKSAELVEAVSAMEGDGWKFGTVSFFNQITLTGVIDFIGSWGMTEVPISTGALRRSGLVNLFAGQKVECRIAVGADGDREVFDLRLAVAAGRVAFTPRGQFKSVQERYPGWGS